MAERASKEWCKKVRKALIDRGMTQGQFAKELGYNRQYLSRVINGTVASGPLTYKISKYLGISEEY